MVIAGIGIKPAVAPLLEAGAEGANGVTVDAYCRTTLPEVFAVGDCAACRNRHTHWKLMRIESVQNATDQASTVADCLADRPRPYDALPWFWSSQYDLRLQTLGLSLGYDEEIVRGDMATRCFSVIYRRAGQVTALDCINMPRDYIQGKSLVASSSTADPNMLHDTAINLKDCR